MGWGLGRSNREAPIEFDKVVESFEDFDWPLGGGKKESDFEIDLNYESYTVGNLDVYAATAANSTEYKKVVVWLHGGGGNGVEDSGLIESGFFGDIDGIKFVFPSSFREGGIWYETYKNDCAVEEPCSVNLEELDEMGKEIQSLIEYE